MSRLLLLKPGSQYITVNLPATRTAAAFGPAPAFGTWESLAVHLLRLGARLTDVTRAKEFFDGGNDGFLIETPH